MKLSEMSEQQAKIRHNFIQFLKSRSWRETELHASLESGEDFYIDAQLSKESSNRSLVSLIQEYDQILFEAEFDEFMLRLSTEDCDVTHSEELINALPHLKGPDDVVRLLSALLNRDTSYTIGIDDDFEPLSADTIGRFAELVLH